MANYRELLAERARLSADPVRNAYAIERVSKQLLEEHDRFWNVEPGDVIRGHKLALPPGVTAGDDDEARDD